MMTRDTDPLKDFLENPLKSFNESNKVRESLEEKLREKAMAIESGLDNSIASDGSLDPYSVIFFTKRHDDRGPAPLIADSLLAYRADSKNANRDLKERISFYIDKYEKEENEKAVRVLSQVKEYIPNNQDQGFENLVDDGAHGWHYAGSKTVVMKRVPSHYFEGVEIPPVLKPLVKFASHKDEQSINATMAHEFTHAWLSMNAKNYGSTDIPGAINEVFAYYISYVVSGYRFSNTDSDLYDRPDLIRWGVQMMVDKAEEFRDRGQKKTGIDFGRSIQLKIYENSVTNLKTDFKILLKACLLKEDKRRLQEFRQLDEQIEANLGGISHLLFGDAKGALKNTEEGKMLEELSEEVTWENPEKMEQRILQNIYNKAVEEGKCGGLLWVNNQVTDELKKRSDMLQKYINGFEKARKAMRSGEFQDHLTEAEEKLVEMRDSLEELIQKGQLEEAELMRAPDVIVDS